MLHLRYSGPLKTPELSDGSYEQASSTEDTSSTLLSVSENLNKVLPCNLNKETAVLVMIVLVLPTPRCLINGVI